MLLETTSAVSSGSARPRCQKTPPSNSSSTAPTASSSASRAARSAARWRALQPGSIAPIGSEGSVAGRKSGGRRGARARPRPRRAAGPGRRRSGGSGRAPGRGGGPRARSPPARSPPPPTGRRALGRPSRSAPRRAGAPGRAGGPGERFAEPVAGQQELGGGDQPRAPSGRRLLSRLVGVPGGGGRPESADRRSPRPRPAPAARRTAGRWRAPGGDPPSGRRAPWSAPARIRGRRAASRAEATSSTPSAVGVPQPSLHRRPAAGRSGPRRAAGPAGGGRRALDREPARSAVGRAPAVPGRRDGGASARAACRTAGRGAPVPGALPLPTARAQAWQIAERSARSRASSNPRRQGRLGGFVEPPHPVAEELDLVGRLGVAGVAQARRAVGGQRQQRDGRTVGLGHRRQQVGGGGSGGGDHRRRSAGGLGQAEGDEGGRALVDHRQVRHVRVVRGGERQGRRTRAGGDHRPAQAAAGELVEDDPSPQGREIGRGEVGAGAGHRGVFTRSQSHPSWGAFIAPRIAPSLSRISSTSTSGSLVGTMPPPA